MICLLCTSWMESLLFYEALRSSLWQGRPPSAHCTLPRGFPVLWSTGPAILCNEHQNLLPCFRTANHAHLSRCTLTSASLMYSHLQIESLGKHPCTLSHWLIQASAIVLSVCLNPTRPLPLPTPTTTVLDVGRLEPQTKHASLLTSLRKMLLRHNHLAYTLRSWRCPVFIEHFCFKTSMFTAEHLFKSTNSCFFLHFGQ